MVKKVCYIVLLAGLIIGVGFFSGCKHHGHSRGAEFALDYVTEVLDLNEAQQAHLNQIKEEFMEKRKQMRTGKTKHHDEIMALLGSEKIDPERVKAMVAEHRAHMNEMIDLAVERFVEFHRTLTAEQKAKLVKKAKRFEKCREHKWG